MDPSYKPTLARYILLPTDLACRCKEEGEEGRYREG